MATAKTGSNKGKGGKTRMLGDDVVVACLYNGRGAGGGKYLAGLVRNELVRDESGRPLKFREIGETR